MMANNLLVRQNEIVNLEKLAAQRLLYSRAKIIMGASFIAIVLIPIVLSCIAFLLNNVHVSSFIGFEKKDIGAFVGLYGAISYLIDELIFSEWIARLKKKAAKIQEYFDTTVYGMSWNSVVAGSKPDDGEIHVYATDYKRKFSDYSSFENWYSLELAPLDDAHSIILCQKTNVNWDVKLREEINFISMISVFVILVLVVFFGFGNGITLNAFITNIILTMLPIFQYYIRQRNENNSAIEKLGNLRSEVDAAWDRIEGNSISNDELIYIERHIQNEIFNNRKDNRLVFDFIYEKRKSRNEDAANYSISRLVDSLRNRRNP